MARHRTGSTTGRVPTLAGATGSMAVATLVSRITGFASRLVLVAVIGLGVVNDSYLLANTLPNIVYELLLGGVLGSVVVPLLVRAARQDPDGGTAYTQRLVAVATTVLVAATAVVVAAAPLLIALYQGDGESANPALATAFAYLLLPEIVFYGLGALFGAILNARGVFGPPAWAPVANNLVVIATLGVYALVPGEISVDPVRMGDTKLLVLGIGTTLGIAVQAALLLPALRRTGFRFRWRWTRAELLARDGRLAEAGRLTLWVAAYVVISQFGFVAITRAAYEGDAGGVGTYTLAWMLFQLPYGIIGVSLITAILPRMARSAADGDTAAVVADLSLGSRYLAVLLVPVSVALTVTGSSIGLALFSFGASDPDSARRVGLALAFSAFGLLPYAVVMLQLRVFYAGADARTPTLIMLGMTLVKVPLVLACPALLDDRSLVSGLAFVNAATFVLGAVVGQVWLRARLGRVETGRVLVTVAKCLVAAVPGVAVALGARAVLDPSGVAGAWLDVAVSGILVVGISGAVLLALRTDELTAAVRPLVGRFVRR